MFADVVAAVEGATDVDLMERLREVEARRRTDAAEEALLLAELERRKVFAHDGHATMWGLLRAMVGWSDGECRARMRTARLVAAFSDAGELLHEQVAPVASVAEIVLDMVRGTMNGPTRRIPRCRKVSAA